MLQTIAIKINHFSFACVCTFNYYIIYTAWKRTDTDQVREQKLMAEYPTYHAGTGVYLVKHSQENLPPTSQLRVDQGLRPWSTS